MANHLSYIPPILQFKWILDFLVPEPVNTLNKKSEKDLHKGPRVKVATWLVAAMEAGILVPINHVWIEENKKNPLNSIPLAFDQAAKLRREDFIFWIEKEEIIKALSEVGLTIPEQKIETLESYKKRLQSKSEEPPVSPNEEQGPLSKLFPVPEGCGWSEVYFTITHELRLKIKVRKNEQSFSLQDFEKIIPQKQQRELLYKIIQARGTFDKEILQDISGKAYQNFKQTFSKLRKTLKDLFVISDDPLPWKNERKQYEAQFSTHLEEKKEALNGSELPLPEDNTPIGAHSAHLRINTSQQEELR